MNNRIIKNIVVAVGLGLIILGEWEWLQSGLIFLQGFGLNSTQTELYWVAGIMAIFILGLIVIFLVNKVIDYLSNDFS